MGTKTIGSNGVEGFKPQTHNELPLKSDVCIYSVEKSGLEPDYFLVDFDPPNFQLRLRQAFGGEPCSSAGFD